MCASKFFSTVITGSDFLLQGVSKQISLEEKLDEIEEYPFTIGTCASIHAAYI